MLPDLLVIGAMKSGTTSLWSLLDAHPQVHMAARKEVHFFDRDDRFARGPGWYEQQFAGATDQHVVVGEVTPSYARWPQWLDVPRRAASVVPQARLVYLLRHPLERVRSHYVHDRAIGLESLPFDRAVREHRTYVDTSRYSMQLDRWLAHYPREQVLLLTLEQLNEEPETALHRLQAFLGLAGPPLHRPQVANLTRQAQRQRATVHRLKRTAVGRRLLDLAPAGARPAARRLDAVVRRRPRTGSAELTDELQGTLADLLHDDVARLRRWMPHTWDGWGLA